MDLEKMLVKTERSSPRAIGDEHLIGPYCPGLPELLICEFDNGFAVAYEGSNGEGLESVDYFLLPVSGIYLPGGGYRYADGDFKMPDRDTLLGLKAANKNEKARTWGVCAWKCLEYESSGKKRIKSLESEIIRLGQKMVKPFISECNVIDDVLHTLTNPFREPLSMLLTGSWYSFRKGIYCASFWINPWKRLDTTPGKDSIGLSVDSSSYRIELPNGHFFNHKKYRSEHYSGEYFDFGINENHGYRHSKYFARPDPRLRDEFWSKTNSLVKEKEDWEEFKAKLVDADHVALLKKLNFLGEGQ